MESVIAKNKELFVVGGFIFGLLIAVFGLVQFVSYVVYPKTDKIQEEQLNQILREERLGQLDELRKQSDYVSENEKFLSVLVTEDRFIELVEGLEHLAGTVGSPIKVSLGEAVFRSSEGESASTSVANPAIFEPSFTTYYPVTVKVLGDYNALMTFIDRIENDRFYSDIASLSIRATTDFDLDLAEDLKLSERSQSEEPDTGEPAQLENLPPLLLEAEIYFYALIDNPVEEDNVRGSSDKTKYTPS